MKPNSMHLISGSLIFLGYSCVMLVSCNPDAEDFVNKPIEVALEFTIIMGEPFEFAAYSGYLDFITHATVKQGFIQDANRVLIDTTFNLKMGKHPHGL